MWKKVVSFFILTMLFTMILGGVQQATGFAPEVSFAQFGPALGALATWLIFKKDRVQLNFSLPSFSWKALFVTIGVPIGLALIALLLSKWVGLTGSPQSGLSWAFYLWIPFGALGEEIGWRGYLHNLLGSNLSGLISSLTVGLLWAAFHVQLYQNGPIYLLFFLVLIISYTVTIYPIMVRSDFNILFATLFHCAINVSNLINFTLLNETRFMMLNALVWIAFAVMVIMRNKSLFFEKQIA